MRYRSLGNSGIDASIVGLGAWAMGGWMWGGNEEKDSIGAIHAAIDNGINLVDTAPIYGFGYSESVVGKAIKDRRDKVVLATKCGLVWDREVGEFHFDTLDLTTHGEKQYIKVYKYLHPDSIRDEIEKSLKRLDTDNIDLYQTHWQESTTPIEDTMSILLKLRDEGKIRAIGVSNASVEQMEEYGKIDTDQEKYSMIDRDLENNGILDYTITKNIAVLAYSPMVLGLLTGKIRPDRKFGKGDLRLTNERFSRENIKKTNAVLSKFSGIAEKYSISTAQLVIAWTFSQSGVTHVLCGCRNPQQAIENAHAGSISLDSSEITEMNEIIQNDLLI